MQISLSEDVLQKLKLHLKKSETTHNPQSFSLKSPQQISSKTQRMGTFRPPRQISYNEIIKNHQNWRTNRYKLRNCRQPNLKIIEPRSFTKDKISSVPELKQLMKSEIDRFSVKKRYDSALQKYEDKQITDKLKSELALLQTSPKLARKIRYRPHRRIQHSGDGFSISGSKINEKQLKQSSNSFEVQKKDEIDFPKILRKTKAKEFKYKQREGQKKLGAKQALDEQIRYPPHIQQQSLGISGWH